jgi:hypothetical protein
VVASLAILATNFKNPSRVTSTLLALNSSFPSGEISRDLLLYPTHSHKQQKSKLDLWSNYLLNSPSYINASTMDTFSTHIPSSSRPERLRFLASVECYGRAASPELSRTPQLTPHPRMTTSSFPQHLHLPINTYGTAHPLCADDIIAAKIALPTKSVRLPILNFLPPLLRDRYSKPSPLVLKQPPPYPLPRPYSAIKKEEYVKLLHRMMDANMLHLSTSPSITRNGLFCVPKGDDKLRLIMDARPCNALFLEPPDPKLPNPSVLARLVSDREFFVAKTDLSNMYHQLLLPEWLWSYMGLDPIPACDLGLEKDWPEGQLLHPQVVTLPMGFSHAVFLAQTVHVYGIQRHVPEMMESASLSTTSDAVIDRPRHMTYIDDVGFMDINKARCDRTRLAYEAVAAKVGLPVKPSKTVAASSDGVEVIGILVKGKARTVGLAPKKINGLIAATRTLLNRGACTGKEMQRVIGSWTWALLLRRPLLSTFQWVYRFALKAGLRKFKMWDCVLWELKVVCGLAPLLFMKLNRNVLPICLATDASSKGGAVVQAPAPFLKLSEISRPPVPILTSYPMPPVFFNAFNVICAHAWKYDAHINEHELHTIVTAARWLRSQPTTHGHACILLSDSSVCVFSVAKGRSSSSRLLKKLRLLASVLMTSDIQLFVRYVNTHDQPADEASRQF